MSSITWITALTVRCPAVEKRDRWGQLHWLLDHITPQQGAYLAMLPDDCTFYVPGPSRCASRMGCRGATAWASIVGSLMPRLRPKSTTCANRP